MAPAAGSPTAAEGTACAVTPASDADALEGGPQASAAMARLSTAAAMVLPFLTAVPPKWTTIPATIGTRPGFVSLTRR
ncbi:hypothetical protein Phou_105370 [Phytohabitans houttuyneae]|uniref:Uncharacterized protein n=1 Tax=Phytohabitans houttuyneae TaxID=1076126 RepID=A0A6V8KWZ0_9ACTN|nr:hypothetical protein Phou_105370 [Phytohabitans houttuyneae]